MDTWNSAATIRKFVTPLEDWYDRNAEVRRYLAIRDAEAPSGRSGLRVLVVLEPTADGGDTLPVWMAHARKWIVDLQADTGLELRMELVEDLPSDSFDPEGGAAVIAQGRWRDPTLGDL